SRSITWVEQAFLAECNSRQRHHQLLCHTVSMSQTLQWSSVRSGSKLTAHSFDNGSQSHHDLHV
ncbi:Uncharacterized protein DAT39_012954, partial [Clarias magur]